MEKQKFSQEQIRLLKENPYTKSVSPSQIRFTDRFKHEFWQACLEGKTPQEIFQDMGYDVQLIGEKRIQNTFYLISRAQESHDSQQAEEKIERLENEVRRLSFELEALKKIIALGNSKKWTS